MACSGGPWTGGPQPGACYTFDASSCTQLCRVQPGDVGVHVVMYHASYNKKGIPCIISCLCMHPIHVQVYYMSIIISYLPYGCPSQLPLTNSGLVACLGVPMGLPQHVLMGMKHATCLVCYLFGVLP